MKCIAVLNKKAPLTSQLNALAHLALGFAHKYPEQDLSFRDFTDTQGQVVSDLTDHPFIILTAKNSNKLYQFHQTLTEHSLPQSAFWDIMIHGETIQQQVDHVRTTPRSDLSYIAVMTCGPAQLLDPLTKKFSLYRNE